MARITKSPVTVHGIQFVTKQLSVLFPREAKNVLRQTTAEIAKELRDKMRSAVSIRSGRLKKAIISKRSRGTRDSVEAEVRVTHGKGQKNDAWYWHFVEYGTVKTGPKPFAGPAIEEKAKTYREDLRRVLDKRVARMLDKRAKTQKIP